MDRVNCHRSLVRGSALVTIILCFVIVLAVAAILMPVFTRHRHSGCGGPSCQSNLKQIGVAFKTYLSDWDETYPTNRQRLSNGELGPISSSVTLSRAGTEQDGKPIRFQHGISWVEGLYQYIEPVTTQDDHSSVWKCQLASDKAYPPDSETAAVSYVFNANLVEENESAIRYARTLMVVREADRLLHSALRPTRHLDAEGEPPISAFLTDQDQLLGKTNPKLHGTGSYVLFADGHVKLFGISSFPRKCLWSRRYKTWTNPEGTISVSP